ncbi:MAG: hypothetical protein U5N86_09000 [Planctomycetota bacterium]|nr:hypothetical protein [Planctomycetota bacterium]
MIRFAKTFLMLLTLFSIAFSLSACDDKGNTAAAREYAQKAQRFRKAKELFTKGKDEYLRGQLLAAGTSFGQAVRAFQRHRRPRDFDNCIAFRSELHFMYGLSLIDIYMNADKSSLEIRNEQGEVVGMKASPEMAMANMNKSIELAPANPNPYFGKGYIKIRIGEPREALNWLNSAIGRDTSKPDFFGYRAKAYLMLAKEATALSERAPLLLMAQKDCIRSKRLSDKGAPPSQMAYDVFVNVYLMQGDRRSAEQVIQEMSDIGLSTTEALRLYRKMR